MRPFRPWLVATVAVLPFALALGCTNDFAAFTTTAEPGDGAAPDGGAPGKDSSAPGLDARVDTSTGTDTGAKETGPPPPPTTIACGQAPCALGSQQCSICGNRPPKCVPANTMPNCNQGNEINLACDDSTECSSGLCCVTMMNQGVVRVACAASMQACMGAPLCNPSDSATCGKMCQPADGPLMGSGYFDCR